MSAGLGRIGRELFLAAFGASSDVYEDWVVDRLTQILEEHPLRGGSFCGRRGGAPVEHCYFMREMAKRADDAPRRSSLDVRGARWIMGSFEPRGAPAARSAIAVAGLRCAPHAAARMVPPTRR